MSTANKNTNMALWEKYSKTDPSHTKNMTVSGQVRTGVDAQYKKMQITKAFGIYGLGWGVVAGSEAYERTHYENSTCILSYTATAFFVHEGDRGEFPIAASIRESYITNGGKGYLKIDDEAVKKVRTDALTKGFTDLGFNADIFMGKFEDQDYIVGANAAAQIEKEEEQEKAIQAAVEAINEYCKAEIAAIKQVKNDGAFQAAMNRLISKVEIRCKAAGVISTSYTKRINEIVNERLNKEELKHAG